VKADVMDLCKKYNINYCSSGFFRGVHDLVIHLKDVSKSSFEKLVD
jgi:hypothetical protein